MRPADPRRCAPSSGLFGLRCCCILALCDSIHKGEVEGRVGQTFTTPCCKKKLAHREGVWEQEVTS